MAGKLIIFFYQNAKGTRNTMAHIPLNLHEERVNCFKPNSYAYVKKDKF